MAMQELASIAGVDVKSVLVSWPAYESEHAVEVWCLEFLVEGI